MTWIRQKKKLSRPRKLFDKVRIEEENKLVSKYGLKSKKEIWKAEAAVERLRNIAKKLITAEADKQEEFFNKLRKMGFKADRIADVLELNKEDWLGRRLQSILISKNLAKPKEARQLIAHKHVLVDEKKVNIPSYMVSVEEESQIRIDRKTKEMIAHEKKSEEKQDE